MKSQLTLNTHVVGYLLTTKKENKDTAKDFFEDL
jgi:hypothetical protein